MVKTERTRTKNLMVPVTPEEREQLRILAAEADLDGAKLIRRWMREAWAARPTEATPPSTSPKIKKRSAR